MTRTDSEELFLTWATQSAQLRINPNINVFYPFKDTGRGVLSLTSLNKNTILMSIPVSSCLWPLPPDNVSLPKLTKNHITTHINTSTNEKGKGKNNDHNKTNQEEEEENLDIKFNEFLKNQQLSKGLSNYVLLSLRIMHEISKGSQSFFYPYFQILPIPPPTYSTKTQTHSSSLDSSSSPSSSLKSSSSLEHQEKDTTLLAFNKEELAELKGTALEHLLDKNDSGLQHQFKNRVLPSLQEGQILGFYTNKEVSFELWKWTASLLMQRGFNLKHDKITSIGIDSEQEQEEQKNENEREKDEHDQEDNEDTSLPSSSAMNESLYLVPGMDLLNHSSMRASTILSLAKPTPSLCLSESSSTDNSIHSNYNDASDSTLNSLNGQPSMEPYFFMSLNGDVPAHHQIFNSYGHLSNTQLLHTFGFVEERNEFDHVLISTQTIDKVLRHHLNLPPPPSSSTSPLCSSSSTSSCTTNSKIMSSNNDNEDDHDLQLYELKLSILCQYGFLPPLNSFLLFSLPSPLAPTLVTCLTVFLMSEEEFEEWKEDPIEIDLTMLMTPDEDDEDEEDESKEDDMEKEDREGLVTEIRLITIQILDAKLKEYPTTLEQDQDILNRLKLKEHEEEMTISINSTTSTGTNSNIETRGLKRQCSYSDLKNWWTPRKELAVRMRIIEKELIMELRKKCIESDI